MDRPRCDGCRFWDDRDDDGDDRGLCRKLPPGAEGRYGARWPETRDDDWCGEHEPEEAARDS